MKTGNKDGVLEALMECARPLAEVLLAAGITHKELDEVIRVSMVDVAIKGFGIRDRPTNVSRVSVMTGLTRKEVARLRTKIEKGDELKGTKKGPMEKVVEHWQSDGRFLNSRGRPAPLPINGKGPSFTELVKRAGGDVPTGAMRTELKRLGLVEESESAELRLCRKWPVPSSYYKQVAGDLREMVAPIIQGAASRAVASDDEGSDPYRARAHGVVSKKDLGRLETMWKERLEEVVESFKKMAEAYEVLHDSEEGIGEPWNVHVGAYFFSDRA